MILLRPSHFSSNWNNLELVPLRALINAFEHSNARILQEFEKNPVCGGADPGRTPWSAERPLARLLRIREQLRNRVGSWVGGKLGSTHPE